MHQWQLNVIQTASPLLQNTSPLVQTISLSLQTTSLALQTLQSVNQNTQSVPQSVSAAVQITSHINQNDGSFFQTAAALKKMLRLIHQTATTQKNKYKLLQSFIRKQLSTSKVVLQKNSRENKFIPPTITSP
jgi:4-alpha-glucanotransferase